MHVCIYVYIYIYIYIHTYVCMYIYVYKYRVLSNTLASTDLACSDSSTSTHWSPLVTDWGLGPLSDEVRVRVTPVFFWNN